MSEESFEKENWRNKNKEDEKMKTRDASRRSAKTILKVHQSDLNITVCDEKNNTRDVSRRSAKSILNAHQSDLNFTCKKVFFLTNGHTTKAKNLTTMFENTCAFDAVSHILACMYSDHNHVQKLFKDNSQMKMYKFISMQSSSTSSTIFKERDVLLKSLDPIVKRSSNGFSVFDCTTSIDTIVQKLLPHTVYTVLTCKCNKGNIAPNGYNYVPVNVQQLLKLGFKCLEECISLDGLLRARCKECNSKRKIKFSEYIIMNVQPDVEPLKGFKKIKISDIPLKVTIAGIEFNFSGIVEFKPGHFVSHILRKNNVWETYNDSKNKVGNTPKNCVANHIMYVQNK